jgi:hypothetical protein
VKIKKGPSPKTSIKCRLKPDTILIGKQIASDGKIIQQQKNSFHPRNDELSAAADRNDGFFSFLT